MANEINAFDIPALEKIKNSVNESFKGELLKSPADVVTYLIGYYEQSKKRE